MNSEKQLLDSILEKKITVFWTQTLMLARFKHSLPIGVSALTMPLVVSRQFASSLFMQLKWARSKSV